MPFDLTLIPQPDVLPLPAPVWLLEFLLLLTFVLHVVPMNLLLGGSILAAVSHSRGGRDARHQHLARRLGQLMPVVVAFTVTLGVAPLLFVQALYGQLLYSSSILMARAWFLVIPLLIAGYYGVYLISFRWDSLGGVRTPLAWIVAALIATIGFIYSNNFSMMLRPESWLEPYLRAPGGGHLNWSDPSLYPRYLHMLLGAMAVAGLWIMLLGAHRRSGDAEWSGWALGYGARLFVHATLANLAVGMWFLMALPREVMLLFMGRSALATSLLAAAVICALLALGLAWSAARAADGRRQGVAGAGVTLLLLIFMVVIRHVVRQAMLAPAFRIEELQTDPQWGVFIVFAVLLLIGIGIVGWLVSVVLRAAPARS